MELLIFFFPENMCQYSILNYVILYSSGGVAMRRKDCGGLGFPMRVKCSAQAAAALQPAWPGRAVAEESSKTWDAPKPISIIGSTGSVGTQVDFFFFFFLKQIHARTCFRRC